MKRGIKNTILAGALFLVTISLLADKEKKYPSLVNSMGSSLVDKLGKTTRTRTLTNKDNVLIYFSAKWCAPCRKFTPDLIEFYNKNKDKLGFEVVLVSIDSSKEEMDSYMKDYDMPWLAVPFKKHENRQKLKEIYGAESIPCLVLVDRDGKVISSSYAGTIYVGPRKVLEDLLSQK